MKWWHWLILELLIMLGVMTWVFFFPSELPEEDLYKGFVAFAFIFCIEKIREYFKEK